MQDHRRLRVWKKSQELAVAIRRAIRAFPRSGYGSLRGQMVGAAESIVLNIVEGCAATSPKEFARYLDIAVKSSAEVEAQLELARDYGVMGPERWQSLTTTTIDVRRMLCGLRLRVRGGDKPDTDGPDGPRP